MCVCVWERERERERKKWGTMKLHRHTQPHSPYFLVALFFFSFPVAPLSPSLPPPSHALFYECVCVSECILVPSSISFRFFSYFCMCVCVCVCVRVCMCVCVYCNPNMCQSVTRCCFWCSGFFSPFYKRRCRFWYRSCRVAINVDIAINIDTLKLHRTITKLNKL